LRKAWRPPASEEPGALYQGSLIKLRALGSQCAAPREPLRQLGVRWRKHSFWLHASRAGSVAGACAGYSDRLLHSAWGLGREFFLNYIGKCETTSLRGRRRFSCAGARSFSPSLSEVMARRLAAVCCSFALSSSFSVALPEGLCSHAVPSIGRLNCFRRNSYQVSGSCGT